MATKKQLKVESNVAALLNEYAEIQNRIQDDVNRQEEIADQLRILDPGTYEGFGNDHVRVSGYTRLNTAKALSMLSPRNQARVMVMRPDARLIRKHFPGVARRATDKFSNRVDINVSERHLVAVS